MLGKLGIGAAIALLAMAVAWVAAETRFVEQIELTTYDWRMRATARPSAPSDDILLVSINDDSIRRLEPIVGRWPWPRLVHGALVDFLARAPAKVVVYDGLFGERDVRRFTIGGTPGPDGTIVDGVEWTGAKSDLAFAESVATAGNVIVGADATTEGLVDPSKDLVTSLDDIPSLNNRYAAGDCVEQRPILRPPYPELARAARAVGHTFFQLDADRPVRRSVPFIRIGTRDVPSLSVAAALVARGQGAEAVRSDPGGLTIGATRVPLLQETLQSADGSRARACRALIPYRGSSFSATGPAPFTTFSFYDLFYSEQQLLEGVTPEIDPAAFKDRIVVVGATAAATYDVFTSPFGLVTPGSEIHANIIDGLLRQRTIAPLGGDRAMALMLTVPLLVGAAGAIASVWVMAFMALIAGSAIVWLSLHVFARGIWMPLVMPIAAVALTFVGQLAWQYFVEGREKRQVKRLFSRYVPKDVYEQLLADPNRAALGGRRRTMTVLFSDVRGFTAMSEKATPEEVVGQLNEYFSRMVQVLFEHRGTLDKFVGDMVMGLFGAPLDDDDHAEHAMQAALAMTRALDELNHGWAAAGRPVLDIGIGISTGEMVAGNIGSEAIMSYTVIGDRVNLGARLESLNKDYGTRIIISEATREALKGQYDIHPLGEVVVKGKSRPVAIYEVRRG